MTSLPDHPRDRPTFLFQTFQLKLDQGFSTENWSTFFAPGMSGTSFLGGALSLVSPKYSWQEYSLVSEMICLQQAGFLWSIIQTRFSPTWEHIVSTYPVHSGSKVTTQVFPVLNHRTTICSWYNGDFYHTGGKTFSSDPCKISGRWRRSGSSCLVCVRLGG